jgi:hypothetical protein
MTIFFTRLKIDLSKLSAPLLKQFKDGKFRYDVILSSTYQSQEAIKTPFLKKSFSKDGGSSGAYQLDSRYESWEGAKHEISAVWIVYADEGNTKLWSGQVDEMFKQGSEKWNIQDITKVTNAVSKPLKEKTNTQSVVLPVKFKLYGRKAAAWGIGQTQILSAGGMNIETPSLHFVLMIEDYDGVWGTDGQPSPSLSGVKLNAGFYKNQYLTYFVVTIEIKPPGGMPSAEFKKRLMENASNFKNEVLAYSAPINVVGRVMRPGEYNSSSYIAGLLYSVLGYVPKISTPGYQTPGWESPVPVSYFRRK